MLVGVDAFDYVLSLEVQRHKFLQDHRVDRNLTQTYENTSHYSVHLGTLVP